MHGQAERQARGPAPAGSQGAAAEQPIARCTQASPIPVTPRGCQDRARLLAQPAACVHPGLGASLGCPSHVPRPCWSQGRHCSQAFLPPPSRRSLSSARPGPALPSCGWTRRVGCLSQLGAWQGVCLAIWFPAWLLQAAGHRARLMGGASFTSVPIYPRSVWTQGIGWGSPCTFTPCRQAMGRGGW